MTACALGVLSRWVKRLSETAQTDAELLRRFLSGGDDAFAELVRRHGPMILGVCRRVLRHQHDAEDAFQATFLVLARKASAIREGQSIGGWLFQVARRLSLRLRSGAQRQQMMSLEGVAEPAAPTAETPDWRSALDDEVSHLPEPYRSAVILCYVERRSQAEAARMLRTTPEAVNSRLKRARELLRRRLSRHGWVVSVGVISTAWASDVVALSSSLTIPAVNAASASALRLAAGTASFQALTLVREAIVTMSPLHKLAAGFLLVLGLLFVAASGVRPMGAAEHGEALDEIAALAPKESGGAEGAKADRRPQVILLWMNGGPSQLDTFDPKPGQPSGGPFKAIPTATKGLTISEHLPKLAKVTDQMTVIRTLSHREGDHARATLLMRTGRTAGGRIAFPPLPAVLAKELGDETALLPGWVSINVMRLGVPAGWTPGSLDDRFGPLIVGENRLGRGEAGLALPAVGDFRPIAGDDAVRMRDNLKKAFALEDEKEKTRDAYGRNRFGEGCLLARRLIERGVPVVEVDMWGWDTHMDNFKAVERQSAVLDSAFASLLADLKDRKLLEHTLVICMGEFGRTPRINAGMGRDHWPRNFCVVLAGAGAARGKVIGETSADGVEVKAGAVSPGELAATIYRAVGVDPAKEYKTRDGSFPLVEKGATALRDALR